ncbi:conserved hypothetical protein [Culex quinquefasciatus]|uniref:Protein kinase domain-containing protein n=1 Tax=Culex quinquefasciatus TaxID=7176 RepID=B0WBV8_CULQU|nr:conserved hypothetical protein [Culex quinquefasciatus]|eukprot:XP_001846192.1 conserved hypothetical protein [Culex quinquefasciatus]
METLFGSIMQPVVEQVDCPFIVCMTYAFHTPDKLCFILDLMNGGDLHYHLSQHGVFNESDMKFYAAETILTNDFAPPGMFRIERAGSLPRGNRSRDADIQAKKEQRSNSTLLAMLLVAVAIMMEVHRYPATSAPPPTPGSTYQSLIKNEHSFPAAVAHECNKRHPQRAVM